MAVLAAACIAAVVPVAAHYVPVAQSEVVAPDEAEIIDVPFAPPLDQPLRYRTEQVVTKNGATRSTWSQEEVIFSRRDSGYRMAVRTVDSGIEGADPETARRYRQMALEIRIPYVLLLDETGAIESLENIDTIWDAIIRATRRWIEASRTAESPAGNAGSDFAEDMLTDTPPEGRLALLTQSIAPILNYGHASLVLGEELRSETDVVGLMGLTVRQQMVVRAERVEDGILFAAEHMTISREEMLRAMEAFLARIPVTNEGRNTEAERARVVTALRNGQASREYRADYEVDLETGLTRRYRSTDRVGSIAENEIHERVATDTIERLD